MLYRVDLSEVACRGGIGMLARALASTEERLRPQRR